MDLWFARGNNSVYAGFAPHDGPVDESTVRKIRASPGEFYARVLERRMNITNVGICPLEMLGIDEV